FILSQTSFRREPPMPLFSWLHKSMNGRSRTPRTSARKPTPRFRPQLEGLEDRWMPSTFTVLNNLDSGAGSLRADIAKAHSGDTIVFDSSLAGQTINLTSGELLIRGNLTITGLGAGQLTVSAGGHSRVFEVAAKSGLTISGLTISNGYIWIDGGGILNHGTLTITSSTLSNNDGGAYGGAIYNDVGS